MKKSKLIAAISGLGLAAAATFMIAADHIDSPASASAAQADIADFYAFEGEDADSTGFIVTIPDLTGSTEFSEDVMIEINIDNNGTLDLSPGGTGATNYEADLVIQAIPRDGVMYFFGPYAPSSTGGNSTIDDSQLMGTVTIDAAATTTPNGIKLFAGKRNDAFFFDFNRFNMVRSGAASAESPVAGFLPAGEASDFFLNLNVNAIAIEVPNSMLGAGTQHPGAAINAAVFPQMVYNVWVETKQKQ